MVCMCVCVYVCIYIHIYIYIGAGALFEPWEERGGVCPECHAPGGECFRYKSVCKSINVFSINVFSVVVWCGVVWGGVGWCIS